MKQSLHRDEATNTSRQPISPICPISPISPIGPICPISPISLIRPIGPIRLICPIRPIGPINPIPLSGSPPPRGRPEGGCGLCGLGAVAGLCGLRLGCLHKQKSPPGFLSKGFSLKKGGYLLSHGCAVPSARAGLTSLFGMGRGGTPPL